jgi:hypothetical protein
MARRGKRKEAALVEEEEVRVRHGPWPLGVLESHEWPLSLAAAWMSLPRPTPPSPLPLLTSPPLVCGAADGDETPRRLGLGAQGGTVVAYL